VSDRVHSERRDDIASYALGALDGPAAADLERHLGECESCSEYLAWLQPALDVLPASVPQEAPPAGLKKDLMRAVRADAAKAAGSETAPGRRSWRGIVLRPATAFAAVAALTAGVLAGYVLRDDDPDRAFTDVKVAAAIPNDAVAATLEHGGGGDAILHVDAIPALDKGHVYQTWVQREGRMEPATSFRPSDDGTAEAALGDSLDGAEAVAVTEEADAGETRPSDALVLTAPLQ
jgi:anti-sigma factor RsiW